ncbi:MAG TPA: inositol monophosphatase family protein [Candidatus Saccharimonadales bacterium]|nr:inositol monophosphatase family protein [Candidatus Saccharimonadales bacterium]
MSRAAPDPGARALLRVAVEAARAGGAVLRRSFGAGHAYARKGVIDLVTSTDLAAEAAILRVLRRRVPDHEVLAEESGAHASRGGSPFRWLIDPLDGTTNFAHGYPFVCTSVAVVRAGRAVAGAVFDPLRDELFTAARGHGARCNGRRIRVSAVRRLREALLVTGFPYDVHAHGRRVVREFQAFLRHAQGIRRDGSAALNLCYLACGRFDGFWELRLHPWDVAAGSLIATEAGGRVTDYGGGRYDLSGRETLASNRHLHRRMQQVLETA